MYTPIDFLNSAKNSADPTNTMTNDEIFKLYHSYFKNINVFDNTTEFKRFILSPLFLEEKLRNKHKYSKFNDDVIKETPKLLSLLHMSFADFKKFDLDLKSEWRDYLVAPMHFNEWAETKQVYKPDKDFCLALQNTEKIKFEKEIVTHLPLNTFYIDLSDLNDEKIHGIFVFTDYNEYDEELFLTLYVLSHDLIFFSHHIWFNFNNKDCFDINKSELEERSNNLIFRTAEDHNEDAYEFSYRDLTTIALHLLMYLGSTEPDIEESPVTKNTYKPRKKGTKPKNKFSEVQMFDVGFKYGSAFRKKLQIYGLKHKDISFETEKQEKSRKSPSPHIRCAHWAHRWAGPKTNQFLKLVWIEPCFVGFGEAKDIKNATIHKIQK